MEWKCDLCGMTFDVPTMFGCCPFCGSTFLDIVDDEEEDDEYDD